MCRVQSNRAHGRMHAATHVGKRLVVVVGLRRDEWLVDWEPAGYDELIKSLKR